MSANPCCARPARFCTVLCWSASALLLGAGGFALGMASAGSPSGPQASTALVAQDSPLDAARDRARRAAEEAEAKARAALGAQQDDPEAMMQAWMEANKTGPHHELLNDTVGKFNAELTMWNAPGAPPETMVGTMTNSWVLNNRFIRSEFTADFGGMPFAGIGYTGYSNADKKYQGIWMDNMGTAIEYAHGTIDMDTRTISLTATSTDPISGMKMDIKEQFIITGPNEHTMIRSAHAPDGTEINKMKIVYTRAN